MARDIGGLGRGGGVNGGRGFYNGGGGFGGTGRAGGARPLTAAQKARNKAAKTYITKGAKTTAQEIRDAKTAARMKKVWQDQKRWEKTKKVGPAAGVGAFGAGAVTERENNKRQALKPTEPNRRQMATRRAKAQIKRAATKKGK